MVVPRAERSSALSLRQAASPRRLVWSESDDLPGLVVDQFGDTLVAQIQTVALEKRSSLVGDVLAEVMKPAEIIFRNDAPIRRLEGLPLEVHTRSGASWEPPSADRRSASRIPLKLFIALLLAEATRAGLEKFSTARRTWLWLSRISFRR